ncbi:FliG C-terminal domain-containing protein [Deltaproteobacteria bacterium TL4]
MRNLMRILAMGIVCLGLLTTAKAQERVKSLQMKQYEIEDALRSSLKYYLAPQDYVLKVWLKGRVPTLNKVSQFEEVNAEDALPGFEQARTPASEPSRSIPEEGVWEITQMRIDLVLYKEISPSISTYITEIVPVLSGLNLQRGDQFNFLPIKPELAAIQKEDAKTTGDSATSEKQTEIGAAQGKPSNSVNEGPLLTLKDWILLGLAGVLVLLLLTILWKLGNLQKTSKTSPASDHYPAPSNSTLLPATQDALKTIERAREEMWAHQQAQIDEMMLNEENHRLLQEVIKQLVGRDDWNQQLIQELTRDKQSTETFIKLIAIMGPQTARKIFSKMIGSADYLDLEKMVREVHPSVQESHQVLKDVWTFLFTKKLIAPEDHHTDPFIFLKELSPNQISFLIEEEPAKIKAIVISRLSGALMATILQKLPKEERTRVMIQLGKMEGLPLDLIEQIAYTLASKAQNLPDDNTVSVNGVELVVDVLGETDAITRQEILNGLRVSDQKLSEIVEGQCFIFDSIPVVPRDVLLEVVRKLPPDDVLTAICGAPKEIQEAVVLCFPEQSRGTLVSALKAKTPTVEEIKGKRRIFSQAMRQMAADDKVNLKEVNATWEGQNAGVPALGYE